MYIYLYMCKYLHVNINVFSNAFAQKQFSIEVYAGDGAAGVGVVSVASIYMFIITMYW